MQNALAGKLKNYYSRQGNRVVFKNSMTLNQLAWEMWEKLGFHGVDASVLSKVLHSKRLFTPQQLEAFCYILNLGKAERNRLESALQQDILTRCGLKHNRDLKSSEITGEILEYLAEHTYKLRTKGNPREAIEVVSFLEKISKSLEEHYPVEWEKNKKVFARALNERSRAWGEIASPKEVLSLILPDAERAINLGKKAKDQDVLAMAYMNIGGAEYVAKNWQRSANYLEKTFREVDADTQIEFLRTLALNYAFLGKKARFKQVRKEAIKRIERKKFSNVFNVVSLLEALGRGLAVLNSPKEAFSTLDEAEKLCLKAERERGDAPFFESQIIRGKIFSLLHSPKIDKDRFIVLAKRGLGGKFRIYKRHQQQIKDSLQKLGILNKCL